MHYKYLSFTQYPFLTYHTKYVDKFNINIEYRIIIQIDTYKMLNKACGGQYFMNSFTIILGNIFVHDSSFNAYWGYTSLSLINNASSLPLLLDIWSTTDEILRDSTASSSTPPCTRSYCHTSCHYRGYRRSEENSVLWYWCRSGRYREVL